MNNEERVTEITAPGTELETKTTVTAAATTATEAGSGVSDGSQEQQGSQPQKPYMLFEAGPVVQESDIAGIKFDFNYGARVTVPQGE